MILLSRDISPFSARVRASVLAKDLPIQIVDDPDVTSDEFGRLNPVRRVPVLVLDDGTAIPESDTIVEYLEDTFPEPPLRPADSAARARVRLVSRVAELYVFPAAVPIFMARATGDAEQIETHFGHVDVALARLAPFLEEHNRSWHSVGGELTTADGALAPFLFYVHFLGKACDRNPLAKHARLERFWEGAQSEPVLTTVVGQIARALTAPRRTANTG